MIEAVISDTEVCGKNLVLRRTVTTKPGSDCVSIVDRLTNESYRREEYCLLYHVNLGYPLIDDGARIEVETKECLPRTPWAEKNIDSAYEITSPIPNMEETCYYFYPENSSVSLINHKIGKKFTVSYSGDTLPEFLAWKNMTSGDYAVGLEPATTKLDDLFAYTSLEAGETVEFRVDLKISDVK